MKFAVSLIAALFGNWLLWSGHFDNLFLMLLGAGSCFVSLLLALRMGIVDEEGAPAQLGLWPFLTYAPWLAIEIARSNLRVARIVLSRDLSLKRNLVHVPARQSSELGRVMLANSITLTPGTVSIQLQDREILVHGLKLTECAEDISGGMGRRICALERGQPWSSSQPCPNERLLLDSSSIGDHRPVPDRSSAGGAPSTDVPSTRDPIADDPSANDAATESEALPRNDNLSPRDLTEREGMQETEEGKS